VSPSARTPQQDATEARLGAPPQRFAWARPFIPPALQPYLRGLRKSLSPARRSLAEPFRTVFPYIQCHPNRQQNLVRLASLVESNRVPGDVVECGVLDGGTAALLAWGTRGSARRVHLFDSWQGLPPATAEDGSYAHRWSGQVVGSPRRVRAVMRKVGVPESRLSFYKGWFQDTFPGARIDRISLLHIDADFHDSVALCLRTWAPRLSPGGFIQLDDYDVFVGCRRATDTFLAGHPEFSLESAGQMGTAWYIRHTAVRIA
jgi:O-methyltransferase